MNKPGQAYDEFSFCEAIYEMCELFTFFVTDVHREHEELITTDDVVKFMSYSVHIQMEAASRMVAVKEREIEEIRKRMNNISEETEVENG